MFLVGRALKSAKALQRFVSCTCRGVCRVATTKEVPVVERETRELQIPVPYGHLAAREWLPASSEDPSRRLLLLHGYQDNAASFYDLVPRLDPRWHAVAIDFTGHGLSSHLPLGAPYVSSLFSLDVARTVAHLGWDRFCIVGHSMGAHCGFNYGALFPDKVRKLVMLDAFGPLYCPASMVVQDMRKTLVENVRLERKDLSKPPVYTEKEVMKVYTETLPFGYQPGNVRTLMKRGWRPVGEGRYVLTKDVRLRCLAWNRVDSTAVEHYYRAFPNDLLVLMAVPGLGGQSARTKLAEDVCRMHCRSFQLLEVAGNHHVHMSDPDRVACHIRPFLESQ